MRSDLEKLRSISVDNHLRVLLETIIIEDDCKELDPWASSELHLVSSSYDIWPRNNAGKGITSDVGVVDLTTMLREKLLSPKTIKIRDYKIAHVNFQFSPEMVCLGDLMKETARDTTDALSVAGLARDVIHGANLAVTSLAIHSASLPLAENSVIHSTSINDRSETSVLEDPRIKEAIIKLSPEYQGQEVKFSILRSAELLLECEATSYWLEQIFYKATMLRTLSLSIKSPWSPTLTERKVVPKLTEFVLSHTTIPAKTIVAMLASSKVSLTKICLRQITLNEGFTWREFLSFIGNEYLELNSFNLAILREKTEGNLAIDFREIKGDNFPEECRPGLKLVEKGPSHNRRITTISYSGANAGYILNIISRHMKAGIPSD